MYYQSLFLHHLLVIEEICFCIFVNICLAILKLNLNFLIHRLISNTRKMLLIKHSCSFIIEDL